jgi:WD40 repeat protein/tRNA A-37 threonylcarbamoyl transferase component Bud32
MRVSDDPRVGTELAGYRIESLLGWGGMSVVYLADDLRLKRRVALKLLTARLADDGAFRERFLRESELAASIDHPNIVPIYEAGTAEGVLFIAMRYVEGGDLKQRVQLSRMDPADGIGILAQVAIALDAAHGRGLVHRDVKPSNILLDSGSRTDGSDHVYLADFGLTKRASDETGSGDGGLMGTIDYVAPEQIASGEVDGMADMYSLGCVLFECLVGHPPFRSLRRESELAVLFAHLNAQPPAASDERPDLPAALDAVIARALAKEPQHRYPSCREFARASYAVVVDEASRMLGDVASRAAAGRNDLTEVEAELAGKVVDLQLMRDHARILAAPATPARVAAEGRCPFKGLANFEPVDADYFFGRERLVAELVTRVVGAGVLGIVGPSGSGKSSVLRAGLLPALAGGVLPGSESWRRLLMRPGERPLDELRRVLVSGAADPLAEALDALPPDGRLLIAVDQLEELFTACRSDGERAAFADALARAAADPQGRAVVVVALRADYYGRFAAYRAFAELLGTNHVLVGSMQASELRRAVELPAGRVGLRVEPELVDALVDDVEGEPGALPLLSTALLELWQKRRDNTLTVAAYRESGGVHGAVARLAESVYDRIADERHELVRAIMLRLVGEGEGHAPVRRRAPLGELDLERNPDVAPVLDALAESRLVTIGELSVEVAHEALLTEWPRLREWIAEDADWRRLRHHITEAATEWHVAGRDQSELYRGARLAAALDWAADHALDLNELEREFVSESREAAERETRRARRTNRRLRALLAGVVLLLIAAVTGGVLAVVQRGDARDAETAQLAQRLGAQALVEEDLDRSLLLARQAVAIDDSPQTRNYLLADLLRVPSVAGVMHGDDDVLRAIAVSPDGSTVAMSDYTAGILFFDAASRERIGDPLPMDGGWVASMAYSPDGEKLALAGNGFIRLAATGTRSQIVDKAIHGDATRIAFTKDGTRIVAVIDHFCQDTWISIRDADTLRPVGPVIRDEALTVSNETPFCTTPFFALTPDGRSLITAAPDAELAWWDLGSRERTRTVRIANGHHALAVSADGRTVAVGIDDGIELVDVRTGAVRSATGALTTRTNSLEFSHDSRTLVSTSSDGTVTVWDARSATRLQTLRGHSAAVQQSVFGPDAAVLYTVAHDGTAIAWDVSGDSGLEQRFTFTNDHAPGHPSERHPGRFSPDGRALALGLSTRGIALWDAATQRPSGLALRETGGEVTDVAFSPDGRTLAAVTVEGLATVWDVDRRSRLRGPFRVAERSALGVSISPDGVTLATAGEEGVRLFDLRSGAAQGLVGDALSAGDVAFSPDGSTLAVVREIGGTVEIWEADGRSRIATLEPPYSYWGGYALAFSPDGRTLASGGNLTDVYVWDLRTGRLLRTLEQGSAGVLGLDFSSDGRLLAVSGWEPVASLWDVATGTRVGPTLTAGDRSTEIDLSPDGRRLLVTHADGRGAVWNVDPTSWARRACAVANRTLTRAEWEQFLPGRRYAPACPG